MMLQMMMLGAKVKAGFKKLISDEKGEVNIVAIVVLIGIAVLLAIIFKDGIKDLLESLLETIKGQATDAVTGD